MNGRYFDGVSESAVRWHGSLDLLEVMRMYLVQMVVVRLQRQRKGSRKQFHGRSGKQVEQNVWC